MNDTPTRIRQSTNGPWRIIEYGEPVWTPEVLTSLGLLISGIIIERRKTNGANLQSQGSGFGRQQHETPVEDSLHDRGSGTNLAAGERVAPNQPPAEYRP